MKILLVAAFACALASAHDSELLPHQRFPPLCIAQGGADWKDVFKLQITKELPADGRLDKFAFCMLNKLNILDEDGDKTWESDFLPFDDDSHARDQADRCKKITNEDFLVEARHIMSCLLKTGENFLELPAEDIVRRIFKMKI